VAEVRPPVYVDTEPVWSDELGGYVDPGTRAALPTWDDALDAIEEDAEPCHVVRFGDECHAPETDRQRAHVERLWNTLRYQPCSPLEPAGPAWPHPLWNTLRYEP